MPTSQTEIDKATIVVTDTPDDLAVKEIPAKASIFRRVGAALIDGATSGILLGLPLVGELAALAYLLMRDGLDVKYLKGRSLGKTLMRLKVERKNGKKMDIPTSILRNLPLAVGPAMMLMPFLGLLFGPIIAIVVAAIEVWLSLTDPDGRRIGDKLGHTKVVNK